MIDLELTLSGKELDVTSPPIGANAPLVEHGEGPNVGRPLSGSSIPGHVDAPVYPGGEFHLETGFRPGGDAVFVETGAFLGGNAGGTSREEVLRGASQVPLAGGVAGGAFPQGQIQDLSLGLSGFGLLGLGGTSDLGADFFAGVSSYSGSGLLTPALNQTNLGGDAGTASRVPTPPTAVFPGVLGRIARLETDMIEVQARRGLPSAGLGAPSQLASGFEMLVLLTRLGYVAPEAFSDPDVMFLLGERAEYLRGLALRATRR